MQAIALEAIARGEAKAYSFACKNADGTDMDLTGKKLAATLRLQDVLVVEKKNTAAGGSDDEIEVMSLGVARVKFAPVDTALLTPCWLDGDLWVYTGTDDPVRLLKFRLPVEQAQTRTFP